MKCSRCGAEEAKFSDPEIETAICARCCGKPPLAERAADIAAIVAAYLPAGVNVIPILALVQREVIAELRSAVACAIEEERDRRKKDSENQMRDALRVSVPFKDFCSKLLVTASKHCPSCHGAGFVSGEVCSCVWVGLKP